LAGDLFKIAIKFCRVADEAGGVPGRTNLPDETYGIPGGAICEVVFLDEDGIDAAFGEVVENAAADNTSSDDDNLGFGGKGGLGAWFGAHDGKKSEG